MTTTELPVPPADPVACYQELPDHFRSCLRVICLVLGTDGDIEPTIHSNDPLVIINGMLAQACEEPKKIWVYPMQESYMICFVRSDVAGAYNKFMKLFAAPGPSFDGYGGGRSHWVADWLHCFLENLKSGHHREFLFPT